MRILLVEDDESVVKVLKKVLTDEHYAVDVAHDGQAGWQLVNAFDYDLVVLDVVLPKLDGLKFCQRLRERSYNMPVLMVTALDSSTKKIAGLNAGADDYITKPFEWEELLARVRVLLRRVQSPILSILEWGELRLDPNSREVTYGESVLNLTPKEYCLLDLFLRNPSQVFSRGAILDNLWSCSEAPGEDTVTAHIKGLRRKLTDVGAPSDLIKTVYGVGYRLKPIEISETQTQEERLDLEIAPAIAPKSSMTRQQQTQQQTQVALAALWSSVKDQHYERLAVLKQVTQALQNQQLTDELRHAATQAAHGLAGALGIFGLMTGSELARAIERILGGDKPIHSDSQNHLVALVNSLEREFTQALHEFKQPQSTLVFPILVLIDDDVPLLKQLAIAIQDRGLNVRVALDEKHLQDLQGVLTVPQPSLSQSGELNGVNPHPAHASRHSSTQTVGSTQILERRLELEGGLPDVVLFNVSLADSSEAALQRLSQLTNQLPPWLMLVCSADGSLDRRVKAAQLGRHSFLHNPDVSTMVQVVLEMRSRLQSSVNTVLVIDDDPHILEALQARLEPQGFQLIILSQPLNFWTTLQASSPDLLLLDIEMPEFSGIELCQAVRQAPIWNQLPIVFFTAHGDAQTKAAALRAGANDVVEKALADVDLLPRLCDQLKRSKLQQAMAAIADNYPTSR